MTSTLSFHPSRWIVTTSICLLTACGGGGDASTDSGTSDAVAQATSATATVLPSDATTATDAAVDAVVAISSDDLAALEATAASATRHPMAVGTSGYLSGSMDCEGGGSLTLDLTGPSMAAVLNGVLDAGERYSVTFTQCQGSGSSIVLNGGAVLDVGAADETTLSLAVSTSGTGLTAGLPGGATSIQGGLSLTRTTELGANSAETRTSHWETPQQGSITLSSARNGLSRSYTLSQLDLTRSQTTSAGVPVASSLIGGLTLAAASSNGRAYSVSLSIASTLTFDETGTPTAGALSLTLPKSTLGVTVGSNSVTVTVDDGPDGVVDQTRNWATTGWLASIGS